MMNCIDLFSGCGGMSLGFSKAGFKVAASIDNWDKAIEVYKANFSHDCYLHDLSDETGTLKIISNYPASIIIGGPPCQDFSSAGKRDETRGKADLTYSFANIVCKAMPDWFVMENVPRITKSHILNDVVEQFSKQGYGLTAVILDASFCGVPQKRQRFFLIGQKNGKHNSLKKTIQAELSEQAMTMREYFKDSLGIEYYYRHPRNYSRRGVYSLDEPSPTVRGVNRPIPKGYNKHPADPEHADLSKIRPLTTIERSYIQTFPKNFIWSGGKTNLEQMIGNAVPVNLANFVANAIKKFDEMGGEVLTELFDSERSVDIPVRALNKHG
jgi:DNA (cytosine-5)-methyltransferase 1